MPEITQRARAGLEPSLTCCRSLLLEPTLIPPSLILPSSCPERTWELIEQWFLMTEGWTTPYWTSQEKVEPAMETGREGCGEITLNQGTVM